MDDGTEATLDGEGVTTAASGAYGPADLTAGSVVHRYIVLSQLGAGGMGAVYAAFDKELDRKVALKLLHGPPTPDSRRGDRLLREAKAMAKLGHPNVVAVYDVGDHAGRVYLAMEFIDGRTLSRWRSDAAPSWREIVDVFVAAGRGLAAAHEAGLVHRDFKPDNVMVGPGARVRVMDFGLARATATVSDPEGSGARPVASGARTDVTCEGTILGTPAYMSPEQHVDGEVGPAADQFAFCVALWEALYGERPFAGDGVADVVLSITSGRVRSPPAGVPVPAWLRKLIERGLSRRPQDRHANMHELLAALQRGQGSARARRIGAAAGVVVVLATVGWGVHRFATARAIAACEAQGAEIDAVWGPAQHETLRAGVVATGSPYAESTLERLIPWLDEQAHAWTRARAQACIRASVEQTWSPDLEDRASWCLADRRFALAAVVDVLAQADGEAVRKAVEAAAGLEKIESCIDAEALRRSPAPPGTDRARIEPVREALSRAVALGATGKFADALAVAQTAERDAEAIAWPPLVAATRYRVAALQRDHGAYEESARGLEDAYFAAIDAGAHDVVFAAAAKLATVAAGLDQPVDARRWSRHARAALAELADPFGLHRAHLLATTAGVAMAEGKSEEAIAGFDEARVLAEADLGPDHPRVAAILAATAVAQRAAGRHLEARASSERVLAIRLHALGPDHPDVGSTLESIGTTYHATAEYERAADYFQRALAIEEAALGPDHPNVGGTLGNLAIVYRGLGQPQKAEPLEARSLAITIATYGPDHVNVAAAEMNRATFLTYDGAYEEALPLYEKALKIFERAQGPEHPQVALAIDNLAAAHGALEHYDEARALHERALAIREKVLGPDHPDTATTLLGLASIALAQERGAEALSQAERAVAILSSSELRPVELAMAQFAVARALVSSGGDRARAVAVAQAARAGFDKAGGRNAESAANVGQWLQEQGAL
jgi:tetratricopeptide (TPR) repeat protein/predicted Ser/Thr protein kinase